MSVLSPIQFLAAGPEGHGLQAGDAIDPSQLDAGEPVQHVHNYFTDETGQLTAGVWTCTPITERIGPYSVNEFMLVLEGSVTIVDQNGHEETMRAGEAFIIPKGMPCIWKQTEFIRKFYVIFDDPSGEAIADPDALKVIRIDTGAEAPAIGEQDTSRYIGDTPTQHLLNLFSDVTKQLNIGLWDTTDMHTKPQPIERNELMHITAGTVTIRNGSGPGQVFNAGDTFMVPKGMSYQWDSEGYVSKIYCIFQPT